MFVSRWSVSPCLVCGNSFIHSCRPPFRQLMDLMSSAKPIGMNIRYFHLIRIEDKYTWNNKETRKALFFFKNFIEIEIKFNKNRKIYLRTFGFWRNSSEEWSMITNNSKDNLVDKRKSIWRPLVNFKEEENIENIWKKKKKIVNHCSCSLRPKADIRSLIFCLSPSSTCITVTGVFGALALRVHSSDPTISAVLTSRIPSGSWLWSTLTTYKRFPFDITLASQPENECFCDGFLE